MTYGFLSRSCSYCPNLIAVAPVTRDRDLSKPHDYEVIMLVPPEVGYPMEPFEWGLPDIQIWCLLIFWLVILLTLGSSKFIVILVTLGKSKLTLHFGQFTVILLSLGKMLSCRKQSTPSPFDKKFKKHAEDLAKLIFNHSVISNHKLGSPVNN